MVIDDPNDPQEPEAPQEPTPAPEPVPAPHYNVDQAYDVIAQAEGWDPRLTRYEIQEHKRRVQEFERERKEFERERSQRYEQPQDNGDPYMQRISSLERIILQDREKRIQEEERNSAINQVSMELRSSFIANARMAGMTKEQADAAEAEFYETVTDVYPDVSMIQKIGSERAARNAFRLMRQGNGSRQPSYNPQVSGRGPTATRTIPGSPQPYTPSGNPLPPEENLSAEQLQGETDQQYEARLRRIIEGSNIRRLPDGMRVQSR